MISARDVDAGSRTASTPVGRPAQGYWKQSWERLRNDRFGIAFGITLVALGLVAAGAPLISTYVTHLEPDAQDLINRFSGLTEKHLLGTDQLGRDTLTRLVWGARVSLGVAFLTVILFMTIGASVGIAAGYYGGRVDNILMRGVDMLLSIPAIFLLIFMATLLPIPIGPDPRQPWLVIKHDPVSLAVIIAFVAWGPVARLVRSEVMSLRQRDFVLAARAVGASDLRLMLHHLLPNVLPVMIVTASLGVGQIILLEAALDFIGVGIQPPTASWGNMLSNAQNQNFMFHSPLLVFAPGSAIVLAVLSANMFGNAARDAFDPRLR